MGNNNNPFTDSEKDYIRTNYVEMAPAKMAATLKRSGYAIRSFMKKEKLTRPNGRQNISTLVTQNKEDVLKEFNEARNSVIRLETQIRSSGDFREIQTILTQEEQDFYVHKYAEYLSQDETLLPAEKSQLSDLLITRIKVNRLLLQEKTVNDLLQQKGLELEDRAKLMMQLDKLTDSQKDLLELIQTMHKSLKMTRAQRLKNINDNRDINLVKIIKQLQDRQNRELSGRWGALIDKAKEARLERWKEKGFLQESEEVAAQPKEEETKNG